jgi:hypothetical protein
MAGVTNVSSSGGGSASSSSGTSAPVSFTSTRQKDSACIAKGNIGSAHIANKVRITLEQKITELRQDIARREENLCRLIDAGRVNSKDALILFDSRIAPLYISINDKFTQINDLGDRRQPQPDKLCPSHILYSLNESHTYLPD